MLTEIPNEILVGRELPYYYFGETIGTLARYGDPVPAELLSLRLSLKNSRGVLVPRWQLVPFFQ